MKRFAGWRGTATCLALLLAAGPLAACGDGGGSPGNDVLQDADAVPDPGGDEGGDTDVDRPETTTDLTPPDATDPTALELVAMGKERLSAGESLAAMDAFDRALALAPGLQDAEWGLVLARFQSTVSMFGSLIGLINLKDDPDAPRAMTLRTLEWEDHEGTIGVTIDGLYRGGIEQQARLDALKAAAGNPLFTLEGGLPLAMGDLPMMRLCCEWDRSDVYGISSFNRLLLALAAFLGSQDTDVSFEDAKDLFREMPGITNAITALMDEHPDLMTLLPGTGEASWRAVGDFVAAAADDALEAARLMGEDDGTGSPVATLADGGIAYLVLHGDFPGDRQELELIWEGKEASLKDVVQKTRDHLGGAADSRLSLDGDVLVAIGVLVDVINRTVGFQAVLDSLGLDLPDIVGTLLAGLDPADPDQLVGLLGTVLPMVGIAAGSVELDLATFLDTPFHLRDFFPAAGPEPGTPHRTFLRSFECVRGGALVVAGESSHAATLFVHDPWATDAQVAFNVVAFEAPGGSDEPFDLETVTLQPIAGFTGLYSGALELVASADGSPADDGKLHLPEGGAVQATYTSATAPDGTATIGGTLADGLTAWDYGAACSDDTKPWDGPHFGEAEFADAVQIAAPGQSTPLAPIPADGKASRAGAFAFPSPSFAGLIWVGGDDGYAVADQAAFNALIGGVLAALEGF
jgi:hypothetical protein